MRKIKSRVSLPSDGSDSTSFGNKRKWFEQISEDPEDFSKLTEEEIEDLKLEAKKLLGSEAVTYTNKTSKGSGSIDYSWMRTVMMKGTSSDKIAANTILIQDSPIHNISTLNSLVSMVKVGKKNECITVIDTLRELFINDLLPPHRKLKCFEARPHIMLNELSNGIQNMRQKYLVNWYFEDQLKEVYKTFIQAIQVVSHDSVDKNKEKAVTTFYRLLAGNPEQENILLANLVNKLGDPSQKVVSKVIYCLTQLLHVHPNMKGVVTEEIEKLLFRANVRQRAQYYGLCFLTQLLFTSDEAKLAANLIKLYFSFFKACIKKGEIDSRLMSALFTGVNRAYPFARNEMNVVMDHIDTVYKVVHIASFNVSLHALCLLFHVSDHTNDVSDRFYSALYKKLLDPQLGLSSHQAVFLNLMYRSIQKDTSIPRLCAFIKRLLQICLYLPVSLVCGILYMISQVINKRNELSALKMTDRILKSVNADDSSGDEHYSDVLDEGDKSDVQHGDNRADTSKVETVKPAWFHCENNLKMPRKVAKYDPFVRNPQFAGGEHSVYMELLKLVDHYHPSVSLFASKILQGEKIVYSGDPLQDFSLPKFLERFVFKNPKKNIGKNIHLAHRRNYVPVGVKTLPVNSSNYLNTDESKIPVDELFMYRYLNKKRAEKPNSDDDADAESVASDEFEEMLDDLMGEKKHDIDFADVMGSKIPPKNKKDGRSMDDEDIDINSSDEEMRDISEDDDNLDDSIDGDEINIDELGEDDDGEELIFDGDDDSESDIKSLQEAVRDKTFSLKNEKKQKKSLKAKGLDGDTFVPAEEFAEILEDTGARDPYSGSSSAVSNKDNAGIKQLKWEAGRDSWINQGWKRKHKFKQNSSAKRKRY